MNDKIELKNKVSVMGPSQDNKLGLRIGNDLTGCMFGISSTLPKLKPAESLTKIVPHRFKTVEWTCPKGELLAALRVFTEKIVGPSYGYDETLEQFFEPKNWTANDVNHFLSVMYHMVKGPIMHHHFRCVVTLLGKMNGGVV